MLEFILLIGLAGEPFQLLLSMQGRSLHVNKPFHTLKSLIQVPMDGISICVLGKSFMLKAKNNITLKRKDNKNGS